MSSGVDRKRSRFLYNPDAAKSAAKKLKLSSELQTRFEELTSGITECAASLLSCFSGVPELSSRATELTAVLRMPGHIADKLIITVRLSEDGNVMALNFRVWTSVLSPEAVICYACPQFTLLYKLMNKVYTCSAQASL